VIDLEALSIQANVIGFLELARRVMPHWNL
jgi:hypothetical protein